MIDELIENLKRLADLQERGVREPLNPVKLATLTDWTVPEIRNAAAFVPNLQMKDTSEGVYASPKATTC